MENLFALIVGPAATGAPDPLLYPFERQTG